MLDSNCSKSTIEKPARKKYDRARAFNSDPLDPDSMYAVVREAAKQIAPFVADTAVLLNQALRKAIGLCLKRPGHMLDIDHGTYPFVTSSSCTAGGAQPARVFRPMRFKM